MADRIEAVDKTLVDASCSQAWKARYDDLMIMSFTPCAQLLDEPVL